ncbi:putative serine/threonine-protein kinase/receptor [Balamuthia mandrillaris]
MTTLHAAVKKNDRDAVAKILKKEGKGTINKKDGYEQTALHLACYSGYAEVVALLLQKGADVNVEDKNGWTPLHSAANSGEFAISKLLIEKGADASATTSTGTTPLHYLVKHFCDADPKLGLSVLESLVQKGCQVDCQTNYGETPLHNACFRGRKENVEFLLKHGADVNKVAKSGETSLHFAARIGHIDVVNMLLKQGADPSVEGSYGTCLEVAKASNQMEVYEILKKAAASNTKKKKSSSAGRRKASKSLDGNASGQTKYGVAFGIKRGACEAPCKCKVYDPEDSERGGPCQSCGHFPVKHKNLGKVTKVDSSSEDESHSSESGSTAASSEGEATLEQEAAKVTAAVLAASAAPDATPSTANNEENEEPSSATKSLFQGASWSIDGKELVFGDLLGVGTSAQVFKGTYRGQEVAVKVLRPVMEPKQIENFKKELDIMGSLRSTDVVYFYGTCLEPKICIVMEYCARGSLYHVLSSKNTSIDWPLLFHIADGMMRGINCLHSWKPQIVHRDLKSLNLLVDDNWNVKVCDFGLSRYTDQGNLSTLGKLRGTFAYCAPEVYFGERFSAKSDIYSVGVILWELMVKCIKGEYDRPYGEYKHLVFDFQIIIQTAKKGLRPTIPPNCPPSYADLIRRCWDAEPDNRPDCLQVAEGLVALRQEYEGNKEAWDVLRAVPFPGGDVAVSDSGGNAASPSSSTATTSPTSSTTTKTEQTTSGNEERASPRSATTSSRDRTDSSDASTADGAASEQEPENEPSNSSSTPSSPSPPSHHNHTDKSGETVKKAKEKDKGGEGTKKKKKGSSSAAKSSLKKPTSGATSSPTTTTTTNSGGGGERKKTSRKNSVLSGEASKKSTKKEKGDATTPTTKKEKGRKKSPTLKKE